jgi:hypothetical protein
LHIHYEHLKNRHQPSATFRHTILHQHHNTSKTKTSGFLKGVTPSGEAGGCDYWIAGGKESTVIFSENYITKSATTNIDGQNISLQQIQRKNINRNGNRTAVDFKYKSQNWQIQGHLTDATTAKDKKGTAAKDRGTMTITNNDGWQANRQIECAYDIGG